MSPRNCSSMNEIAREQLFKHVYYIGEGRKDKPEWILCVRAYGLLESIQIPNLSKICHNDVRRVESLELYNAFRCLSTIYVKSYDTKVH